MLAWGTIAYIAGFFTVMAHTSRLSIPIIEILKPVYIWIGLPLAIVIFSTRWIWRLIRTRVNRVRSEFDAILKEVNELLETRNIADKTVADLADAYIKSYSGMLTVRVPGFKVINNIIDKWIRVQVEKRLMRLFRKFNEAERNQRLKLAYSGLRTGTLITQAIDEVVSAIGFFAVLMIIPIACYFYVVDIYPSIPQSLGGGKPMSAVLILNTKDLPMQSTEILELFPANTASPYDTATTEKLEILYSASDMYYIRSSEGQIVSLSKSLVEGIVWNPK